MSMDISGFDMNVYSQEHQDSLVCSMLLLGFSFLSIIFVVKNVSL